MATEQDHVWAMLDDMLVFLAKRRVPTPERTYKLDGGWTLAMDDLRRFVDALTAERDQLRAEVERLREELTDALTASGVNAKAWQECVEESAIKRTHLLSEIGLTEQQRDAATARAEAAEKEALDYIDYRNQAVISRNAMERRLEAAEAREAGERDYLGEARQTAIELANKLAQQEIAAAEVIAAAKAALTEANDAICGITGLGNMAKQVAIAFSAINRGFKAIAAWEVSDAK